MEYDSTTLVPPSCVQFTQVTGRCTPLLLAMGSLSTVSVRALGGSELCCASMPAKYSS